MFRCISKTSNLALRDEFIEGQSAFGFQEADDESMRLLTLTMTELLLQGSLKLRLVSGGGIFG